MKRSFFRLFFPERYYKASLDSLDEQLERSVPLSIHPDPSYYVQAKNTPYARIRRVIDVSDGGVLGVTGERGAGKSVLLNRLVEEYQDKFFTMNIAAPVSSSKDMEFFIMLFRHLAQQVITALRRREKLNFDDIDSLGREAISRERRKFYFSYGLITLLLFIVSFNLMSLVTLELQIHSVRAELIRIKSPQFSQSSYLLQHPDSPQDIDSPHDMDLFKKAETLDSFKQALSDNRKSLKEVSVDEIARQEWTKHLNSSLQELEQRKWPWIGTTWDDYISNTDFRLPLIVDGFFLCLLLLLPLMILANYSTSLLRRRVKSLPVAARGLLVKSERIALMLDYELTTSAERGFEFSPTGWLKGSSKSSAQEKARGLSLPELTAQYIEYIESVLRIFPGKLLICIDELDKVTDLEQVKLILREIKGALYVRKTFYILSISNDALRSFEGRLGDQRDIFESTFDDAFPVRSLDLRTCVAILRKRMEGESSFDHETGMAMASLCTIAVFSAGNARDLIRGFRECVLSNEAGKLPPQNDAWKILFFRRLESISDRVTTSGGSWKIRSKIISLLENPSFHSELVDSAADDTAIKLCQTVRQEFSDIINEEVTLKPLADGDSAGKGNGIPGKDSATTGAISVAERFYRFVIELEILLHAKGKLELVERNSSIEEISPAIELIMRAYQLLPYSCDEALSVLYGELDLESADAKVLETQRREAIQSLSQPVSDRAVTIS